MERPVCRITVVGATPLLHSAGNVMKHDIPFFDRFSCRTLRICMITCKATDRTNVSTACFSENLVVPPPSDSDAICMYYTYLFELTQLTIGYLPGIVCTVFSICTITNVPQSLVCGCTNCNQLFHRYCKSQLSIEMS